MLRDSSRWVLSIVVFIVQYAKGVSISNEGYFQLLTNVKSFGNIGVWNIKNACENPIYS